MKKTLILLAIVGLLMACGTKNTRQNNGATNTETNQETTSVEPSVTENPTAVEDPQPFFTVEPFVVEETKPLRNKDDGEESFEELISFKCAIDLPMTDNQALYDSICYWFSNQFGSDYNGDPRDVKAMVNHYKDRTLEIEEEEDMEGFELEYNVKMLEANDRYVTYSYSLFFESNSAPRAGFETTYVTFNRNTGQRFTRQMLKVDDSLEQLVMNALFEQFFSAWNDDVLAELLFFDPEDDEDRHFFLPQYDDPWILDDQLCYGYSEHEIADRCTGQPNCRLPYHDVEPYLTESGKAFFSLH